MNKLIRQSHLCDVRTTEHPSLMMLRIQSHRNRRAFGSIPVVGSSCNTKNGQQSGRQWSQGSLHYNSHHHHAFPAWVAETTASYTHTTAAVIHQQEAVTADKVNYYTDFQTFSLHWWTPMERPSDLFIFLSEKQDFYCLRPTCKNWCFVGPWTCSDGNKKSGTNTGLGVLLSLKMS